MFLILLVPIWVKKKDFEDYREYLIFEAAILATKSLGRRFFGPF
jgi:hypothetical protein